jgi:5-methylcytosine-specific restriction endonuclease McrA
VSVPYYQTPEWRALRIACLKRDGFRCQSCGERASIADHKIGRRRWMAEGRSGSPDVLDNLRALCRVCDNRIKEDASGTRRNRGSTGVIGADGFPLGGS